MISNEKELVEKIRLANGELVVVPRKDLRDLWGTKWQGTMARALEFCEQHGFECDYGEKLDVIKFRVPS